MNKVNNKGMGKVKGNVIPTDPTWVIEKNLRSILKEVLFFHSFKQ